MLVISNYDKLSAIKANWLLSIIEKLTDAHKRYIVTEKELLSIVEAIKELITILLCQILIIYTDKKAFLVKNLILIECLDGD